MKFKLERGADALLDLFDKNGVTDVVDPERPNLVPPTRRRFFRR